MRDPRTAGQIGPGLNLHIRGAQPGQGNGSSRCFSNRQLSERRLVILAAKGVLRETVSTRGRGANVTATIVIVGGLVVRAVNPILVGCVQWTSHRDQESICVYRAGPDFDEL